jgi:hypothetical protein
MGEDKFRPPEWNVLAIDPAGLFHPVLEER